MFISSAEPIAAVAVHCIPSIEAPSIQELRASMDAHDDGPGAASNSGLIDNLPLPENEQWVLDVFYTIQGVNGVPAWANVFNAAAVPLNFWTPTSSVPRSTSPELGTCSLPSPSSDRAFSMLEFGDSSAAEMCLTPPGGVVYDPFDLRTAFVASPSSIKAGLVMYVDSCLRWEHSLPYIPRNACTGFLLGLARKTWAEAYCEVAYCASHSPVLIYLIFAMFSAQYSAHCIPFPCANISASCREFNHVTRARLTSQAAPRKASKRWSLR